MTRGEATCHVGLPSFSTTQACESPKGAQRRMLQRLQDRPQRRAQARPAGDDVVVGPEEDGRPNQPEWQPTNQPFQIAPRVGAHVRRQAVAPAKRQVVDQRDVAEAVAAAPVDAVGLERVAAIGDEDHRPAARRQQAGNLPHGLAVVGDVLEHLVREDQIEGAGGEGQALAGGLRHAQPTPSGQPGALGVELDAQRSACARRQALQVEPQAAAIIEHAAEGAIAGGVQDPRQAARLPGAPDVGRLAAQGGAIQVPGVHPRLHSCWKPKPRRLSISRIHVGWKA